MIVFEKSDFADPLNPHLIGRNDSYLLDGDISYHFYMDCQEKKRFLLVCIKKPGGWLWNNQKFKRLTCLFISCQRVLRSN